MSDGSATNKGNGAAGTSKPPPMSSTQRSNLSRQRTRDKAAATAAAAAATVAPPMQRAGNVSSAAALLADVSLATCSAYFAVTGMVAIYAVAPVPIIAMTGVLETSKLAAVAWLGRHWRNAPLLLRMPLVTMVLLLMVLTAAGTFGYLTRAHLDHRIAAAEAVDRATAPLVQRIGIAEAVLQTSTDALHGLTPWWEWRRSAAAPRTPWLC